MSLVLRAIRWVVALTFAIAAGLKLAVLLGQVRAGETPTMFSALPVWSQWGLVTVELGLATWLASGWRQRWGAFAGIVVLSAFLAAIIVEMGKDAPHACGCLGSFSIRSVTESLWVMLAGDSLLVLGLLWIYFAALRGEAGRAG